MGCFRFTLMKPSLDEMSSSWIWILDSARMTGWCSGLCCQFALAKEISGQDTRKVNPSSQSTTSKLTHLFWQLWVTLKGQNSGWRFHISHKTARGNAQFQHSLFPGLQWETSSNLVINPNCKFSMCEWLCFFYWSPNFRKKTCSIQGSFLDSRGTSEEILSIAWKSKI